MTQVDLKSLRRGQLEVLGTVKGIENAGELSKDDLVAQLTAIGVSEEDLTGVGDVGERRHPADGPRTEGVTGDEDIGSS